MKHPTQARLRNSTAAKTPQQITSNTARAPRLGAGESGTARRNMGKASGNPRRSSPVAAETGPAEGAAQGVEIRLRFDAEQWRDITRCAAHDQATPEKWLRNGALKWVPVTLDEIQRQAIPEKQRKAEDDALMFKIRYVMGWPASAIFSPEEKQALALCAEWNGMDLDAFIRWVGMSMVESNFTDLELSIRSGQRKDQAWNRRFHRKLAPIMAALGWNGHTLPERSAKA